MSGPLDSVTFIPHQRRAEEARRPAIIVVGSAEQGSIDPEARLVTFAQQLAIGRRPVTDVRDRWVVRDRMVSSQHAYITRTPEGYELSDPGSTNGTIVDGIAVLPKIKLRDGALIFIGTHVAVFRLLTSSELDAIRAELDSPLGPVPTANPGFALTCSKLRKLAQADNEVLLTGETGAGKEVYAHAVHNTSGRSGKFVAINCAAIPRELVESELFGYMRGAHSQAMASKPGIIEEAEGGTLFLDEIGDMAPELQTKLLRFTQDRMLIPVGGTKPRRIDTRILAATSRTAPPAGSTGGLRTDLAARLGAEPIRVPPLREHLEDLGALVCHFLGAETRAFELTAYQALCLHSWPGNVRELNKVITTASALSRGAERIGPEHLPSAIAAAPGRIRTSPLGRATRPPPSAIELEDLMRRFRGNMLRVARELDRKPALVYRWAHRFNLNPDDFRDRDE